MITTLFLVTVIPGADPLPLPSPVWLLRALLLLTFTLHILAMNFVLGGSILLAIARLRGDDDSMRLAKSLGAAMPTVAAAAITLGVAPLLFLQTLYGRLFFSSAVLIAWFWLAIVPMLIAGYYGTYWIAFRQKKPGSQRFAVLSAVVALLFIAIAFVQSTNMTLMVRPDQFLPKFLENARGVQLNLGDPTFGGRYLHMLLGAIGVAGMFVALYGASKLANDPKHGEWAIRFGALWFVVATGANVLTGLWWLGTLPREVLLRFMGQDVLASLALAIGIVLGFALIGLMFIAPGHPRSAGIVKTAASLLVATIVAMVLARDGVRTGMLAEARFTQTTWVEPHWGVIAIFLVLLVAGVGTAGWMASLLWRPSTETVAESSGETLHA
jgi:hypothetical protein